MMNDDTFSLKVFAAERGIVLRRQDDILREATDNITAKYGYDEEQIKDNFDSLIFETEAEAYRIYLAAEQEYGEEVFATFINYLETERNCHTIDQLQAVLGDYFKPFDRFFLSLKQSRTTRAGKTFEGITKNLFEVLDYPNEGQVTIDGGSTPDFLMPSAQHYNTNAPDCIIFTAKRTLRERWRQIVTEGTRGLGFFLATMDEKISVPQLREMLRHRIYVVVPEKIKEEKYPGAVNVLSFRSFFKDHLDPALDRWHRNGVV